MPLPRLRTMKDVVAELKSEDPHFPVTYYNFRNLVLSGKIPSRRLGGRRSALLVNMDDVYRYYATMMTNATEDITSTGCIPIKE